MASGTIPTLSKTISIDWSDGDSNFGSIISSSGSDKNYKLPISTLNAAIASAGIPADATVTGISITYTMWI